MLEKCDYSIESSLSPKSICGIDEAGRGPWAGPVIAAAVILDSTQIPAELDDSKKLSSKKRAALFDAIYETAHVGVGAASVEEIDELNILNASLLAMKRAYNALPIKAEHALIDGNQTPSLPCLSTAVVKGDSKSVSIAAASIIAKVTRDRLMADIAEDFPFYGWEKNAGYGTVLHKEGLAQHGVTIHHRLSFAPIKKLVNQTKAVTKNEREDAS